MEITEIGLLLAKKEASYGTDPAPTLAANIIPVVRDQITYTVNSTDVPRKLLDGSLDALPGFNALPNVAVKIRYELRGNRRNAGTQLDITNGTAAQALEIDCLLQAANLIPVYTAAGTPGTEGSAAGSRDGYVTYLPAVQTGVGPSVTLYWYTALKLHKLIGGKANIDAITWEAGKMVYLDITITGKYVAVADQAFSTAGAAYLAVKPPTFDGATVTIGGYTPVIQTATVQLGNTVSQRLDATDATGIAGFVITGFDPKGTIDPESVTEAANPFWADWKSSAVKTLTLVTGSDAGNKFQGTFTTEYKTVNYGARDNQRIHSVNFNIVKADLATGAGSQFQLKFF